jgi:hypothetical protein
MACLITLTRRSARNSGFLSSELGGYFLGVTKARYVRKLPLAQPELTSQKNRVLVVRGSHFSLGSLLTSEKRAF